MEKTVGGPDGHGSSPSGRGEDGPEPSKFFSLGKMQRVFESLSQASNYESRKWRCFQNLIVQFDGGNGKVLYKKT
jgi:hypothetical protein